MKNLFVVPALRRLCSAATILLAFRLFAAPGDEHWDPQFNWPGTTNTGLALAVHQGRVYVSGYYSTPALATNNFVEVWDGTRWSYIPGIEGGLVVIYDFAFYSGDLYVAGIFSRVGGIPVAGLARWNGSAWSSVGDLRGVVLTLATDGATLYAGGAFSNAAGVLVTNVARWNGAEWSAMGAGLGPYDGNSTGVQALHFHEGALYAGGNFTNSGGAQARGLARWDGTNWIEVGGGVTGTVYAMASQESSLYAAGTFTMAGAVSANRIARWDGVNWNPLGSGMNSDVSALGVVGNRLYAGGSFTNAGGVSAIRFAVWNGASWAATGSGINGSVNRIEVVGTNVYVSGEFNQADDIVANHVALFDGTDWKGLGQAGRINGVGGVVTSVRAIASVGSDVYVGGTFTGVGPIRAARIARFDGSNWFALGSGLRGTNTSGTFVNAIAVNGTNVYAGGIFTNAGGVAVKNIARWNGQSWSALGNGIPGTVSAIAVRGNDVFVGGTFQMSAAGGTAFNIARWDGSSWSSLPGAVFLGNINNFTVSALAVSGNDLYVGGNFVAGNFLGQNTTNFVRHDGTDWMPVGGGVNSNVNAIAIMGGDVFVGGRFSRVGGVTANRIARWNGSSWFPLDTGMSGSGNFSVSSLAVIGTNLYAGGNFTGAGSTNVSRLARWDGSAWSGLGSGISRSFGNVNVPAVGARGNDLFVGGSIEYAGGKPSFLFARWNDQVDFDTVPMIRLSQPLNGGVTPFKMTVTANVPSYIIEATEDFSAWIPLFTNSASPYEFSDTSAPAPSHRFYRARQGP